MSYNVCEYMCVYCASILFMLKYIWCIMQCLYIYMCVWGVSIFIVLVRVYVYMLKHYESSIIYYVSCMSVFTCHISILINIFYKLLKDKINWGEWKTKILKKIRFKGLWMTRGSHWKFENLSPSRVNISQLNIYNQLLCVDNAFLQQDFFLKFSFHPT